MSIVFTFVLALCLVIDGEYELDRCLQKPCF